MPAIRPLNLDRPQSRAWPAPTSFTATFGNPLSNHSRLSSTGPLFKLTQLFSNIY
jgi:hypothetical protein